MPAILAMHPLPMLQPFRPDARLSQVLSQRAWHVRQEGPCLRGLLEEKDAASKPLRRGLPVEELMGSRVLADTQCRTHRPPALLPLLLSGCCSSPALTHASAPAAATAKV